MPLRHARSHGARPAGHPSPRRAARFLRRDAHGAPFSPLSAPATTVTKSRCGPGVAIRRSSVLQLLCRSFKSSGSAPPRFLGTPPGTRMTSRSCGDRRWADTSRTHHSAPAPFHSVGRHAPCPEGRQGQCLTRLDRCRYGSAGPGRSGKARERSGRQRNRIHGWHLRHQESDPGTPAACWHGICTSTERPPAWK